MRRRLQAAPTCHFRGNDPDRGFATGSTTDIDLLYQRQLRSRDGTPIVTRCHITVAPVVSVEIIDL